MHSLEGKTAFSASVLQFLPQFPLLPTKQKAVSTVTVDAGNANTQLSLVRLLYCLHTGTAPILPIRAVSCFGEISDRILTINHKLPVLAQLLKTGFLFPSGLKVFFVCFLFCFPIALVTCPAACVSASEHKGTLSSVVELLFLVCLS